MIKEGRFPSSKESKDSFREIGEAIRSVVWPPNSSKFTILPQKKANGVKPIKESCVAYLKEQGWQIEKSMTIVKNVRPGPVDALKKLKSGKFFAFEWETGNISSTHRALNKLSIGLLNGVLSAGVVVLPNRILYQWLTDRVGNYEEISPYFSLWESLPIKEGLLAIIPVEHDDTSDTVPHIPKGTDGRAKI